MLSDDTNILVAIAYISSHQQVSSERIGPRFGRSPNG